MRRRDRDIADEIASHLALRAEHNRAAGMTEGEAARDAARRLGSELALRERVRAAEVPAWLDDLGRDLRIAARGLRRAPGFTLLAAGTLAIGLGAAVVMLSVTRAVLVHTLPFPRPAQLVAVQGVEETQGRRFQFDNVPAAEARAIAASGIFAAAGEAGYTHPEASVGGRAVEARVSLASPTWFSTLGATPERGRFPDFSTSDEAVVSDGFWRREMQADPGLGAPLALGGRRYTVVGVVRPGREEPLGTEIWIAGAAGAAGAGGGARVIARLRPGMTPAGAQAAMQRLARRPGALAVVPLRRRRANPGQRTALLALTAAVGCLLLIACLNTAHVLLARGVRREREWWVRQALGASRWRLARQQWAEAVLLAGLGVGAGSGVAWAALGWVRSLPAGIPRLDAAALDGGVLAWAGVAALGCALACGATGWRRSRAPARAPFTAVLVAEVALTAMVLIGGALLLRSFQRLARVDPGFDPHGVATAEVFLRGPAGEGRAQLWRRRSAALEQAREDLGKQPGVTAVGAADALPFQGTNGLLLAHPGDKAGIAADWIEVGPGYFATLRMPLLRGREFTAAEMAPPARAVIVNQALARALFGGGEAVGRRLEATAVGGAPLEVVGVVADTREAGLGRAPRAQAFFPLQGNFSSAYLVWRSRFGAHAPGPRAGLAAGAVVPLEQVLADSLAEPRFRTELLDTFAGLALGLAAVGIYGVMAYEARRRRAEFAVRMALGADARALGGLIIARGARVLGAGLLLGAGAGWALKGYLASILFGVAADDARAWLGAVGLLLAAGLAAAYVPARRAARVDPAELLRAE